MCWKESIHRVECERDVSRTGIPGTGKNNPELDIVQSLPLEMKGIAPTIRNRSAVIYVEVTHPRRGMKKSREEKKKSY